MQSLPLTLLCYTVLWLIRRVTNWRLVIGSVVGIALTAIGIGFALTYYPWTDLVFLLVVLTGEVLLGRVLSPRFGPCLIVLLVLSVLDLLQVALTGSSIPQGGAGS